MRYFGKLTTRTLEQGDTYPFRDAMDVLAFRAYFLAYGACSTYLPNQRRRCGRTGAGELCAARWELHLSLIHI